MQEEMISAAERRATEAEEKEQRLCTLVSAKALARQALEIHMRSLKGIVEN